VNLEAPATDPPGYTFQFWGVNGAEQPSKSITFTMTANTTAFAQYAPNTYTLSVNSGPIRPLTIGSTTGDGNKTLYTVPRVAYGTLVNLEAPATDPPGYTFQFWGVNGAEQPSKSITFTMTANTTAFAQYAPNTYTLNVNSGPMRPLTIGSTTGDGNKTLYTVPRVAYGTPVNLEAPATDPPGYIFEFWGVNGAEQPSKSITFTMTADTTAFAQYAPIPGYTLLVQSTPPTKLSIGSSNVGQRGTTNYPVNRVLYGTSVNLVAPAKDPTGYTFLQWTVNGAPQPTAQKTVSFTMIGSSIAAIAVYTPVVGSGAHTSIAIANAFTPVTDRLTVESTPPSQIVITSSTGDSGITNYTVSSVALGTSVNLQAPAADPTGYTFSQWTVNGAAQTAGQKSITVTMTSNMTAVAQYILNSYYTLTVQSLPPTGQSIASSTGNNGTTNYYTQVSVASGTSANLQAPATDPAGYAFSQWTVNGMAQTAGLKNVTFTIAADTTAVAQYTPLGTTDTPPAGTTAAQDTPNNGCTLIVQSTPPTGVSVSSSTGDSGTTNYTVSSVTQGTSVNLQAPAADPTGYTFSQWTVDGVAQTAGQRAVTFTMTAATTAVAQYTPNVYPLTVQSTPPTGGIITSSTADGGLTNYTVSSVGYGTSVSLQAPAVDPVGYTFSQWTLNGAAQTAGQKSITFTVSEATTAVAQYTANTYALTVRSPLPTGVLITSSTGDGGTTNYTAPGIAYGTIVNLAAPAKDPVGYTFSQWTLNGAAQTGGQDPIAFVVMSADMKSITFAMSADITAVAQYTLNVPAP
jgi:uncharacterized protein involved in propanediol utilization